MDFVALKTDTKIRLLYQNCNVGIAILVKYWMVYQIMYYNCQKKQLNSFVNFVYYVIDYFFHIKYEDAINLQNGIKRDSYQ